MDLTFNHLLRRAQPQLDVKIGSPWLCIPIKNDKQARDTTELHMANQGANGVKDFAKFPNLEMLWLNNNQLTEITGLDTNFRIKGLYVQDNKIRTLVGSLQRMGHLEALVIYNNELRDLDKNLEILKEFPYLTELELFQNPLAEEPYYRMRVIVALPNLTLLDRHVVTDDEKRRAFKWAKEYYSESRKKKPSMKRIMPSQAFSKNETLLYREVALIKQRKNVGSNPSPPKEEVYGSLPTDHVKEELRRRRREDPLSLVNEWEKGKLKKLFKAYDRDKKAVIRLDDVKRLYKDLLDDKANLGKVPSLGEQEVPPILLT